MLEQPLPAGNDDSLQNFIHPLPICADESCHTRADLAGLVGRYDMVNIKLDKSGGLTEALLLAEQAKSLGFAIMLGCMLCTSRAIRAALPLAPVPALLIWMALRGCNTMSMMGYIFRPVLLIYRLNPVW